MARFCGNCGTKLDDNAKVCGQCGTPWDGEAANISGLKVVSPEKKNKVKKKVKLVAVMAVIIVVAVIAFNIASKYTGYNGLLRKVMTAYENYDIDTLVSLSSDMYYYGTEDFVENYFECNVGDDLDSFESSVGHSYSISYKINEIYTLSDRKRATLLETIESTYTDFDVSTIGKVVVADITVTAKQGSKSDKKDIQVTMSKEGDAWKLLYIEKSTDDKVK